MKILKILPAIAGILFAQSVSVRGPELTMSGSTISHARTDGNIHVPRSFGVPDGYQLTTHGGSGDAYWAAPGGAFVDSARAARKADTAIYATVAGRADSARVSGLSDSAKALVRYARTTAVHDTADSVRAYARARIHDTAGVLRDSLARRGTESTGLWYFPAPYISIASSTTFSVAPVRGQIVNTTGAPGLTRVRAVNFAGVSGVTPASLTTAPITYILLDSNGALVQQTTVPSLDAIASNIYLGSVNHPGRTVITSTAIAPDVASRPQDQIDGMWRGLGYINRGVIAYPHGADLSLNISGGAFYGPGIGWSVNSKTPVFLPVGPYTQVSMRLRTRSSTTSASTIYVDPANWDNGGTLTAVGGGINSATNQRIYITPAGQVIVAYGQQVYASLAAAVAGISSENFIVDSVTVQNLQLLGTLSVIRTATALNNTAQAIILNASKFGELSAGSAGTATTTMQGVYDNSTPPQILTDATRGALTIKRGSASDTNAVIAVQNGAGTTTARIKGDGSFTGSMPFANLTSKPTTLSGYGITDAQPLDADLTAVAALTGTGYAKRTATTPTWAVSTTIPASDITGLPTSLPPSGAAGGDLGGTYPNPTVQGLKGVSWPTLANGVPRYNGGVTTWDNSLWNQAAGVNKIWATPDGSLTGPNDFRSLTAADLPATITSNTTGGAATLTASRSISMTGDGTWSVSFNGGSNVSGGMTLASVITAGSAGSASQVPVVTWDAKGRLTAVSSATITPSAIGAAPAHSLGSSVVLRSNGSGGFAASQITDAGSGTITLANNTTFDALSGTQINLVFRNTAAAWTSFYASATEAGFRDYNDDGSTNSFPIYWARGTAGTLNLGGGGRPINLRSGSILQHNGTTILNASRSLLNLADVSIAKGANDNIGAGSFLQLADAASGQTKGWALQLGESNTLDFWNYSSGAWTNRASISSAGVPKFSGLTASKFVKTDASKNLVSADVAYSDLTGTVPTWNQSTTGNAATATKWATARTLTIGATGKAVDGSANVSWSLGEIGALPLAGGVMNSGAQIKVVADVTTSTSTNTVFNSAPLLVSRASSSGSAVAAIGFVNPGLNGAALYYSTSSDFRYNRHDGSIATIWDNSNLTNLSQLTNGPGYITSAGSISGNAATATKWATARTVSATGDASWSVSLDGSANVSAGLTLASIITAGGPVGSASVVPVVTWDAKGRLTAVSSATITPAAIGAASASSLAGYLPIAAGSTHSPGSYSNSGPTLNIGDGQYGLSAHGANLYLWSAPAGQVVSTRSFSSQGAISAATTLSWGGNILQDMPGATQNVALYASGVGTPTIANCSFRAAKNGSDAAINGSQYAGLLVNGVWTITATSTGADINGSAKVSSLAGTGTRMVTAAADGTLGATSWAYDGPWLPLAGGTVTGATTFNGIYVSIPTQLLLSSTGKIRTGLLDIYSNNIEALGLTHFMGSPGFQFDDGVPLAIKSAATVGGTGGSLAFDSDAKFYPKRIHITATTYTLPVVSVGETILLTFDVSACQISTNSSQSVTWRAANGANSFAAASTTNFDSFGYGTGTRIASVWLTGVSSTRVDIRG